MPESGTGSVCLEEGDDVNPEMMRTAWNQNARDTSTTEAQWLSRGVYLTSLDLGPHPEIWKPPQFLSILFQQVADNFITM